MPKAIKLLKPHFVREIIAKMPKHKAKAKQQACYWQKQPKYIQQQQQQNEETQKTNKIGNNKNSCQLQ